MSGTELRDRLATSIMEALVDASKVEGTDEAFVPAGPACEALIAVLAILIEGSPTCSTQREMRDAFEAATRDLRRQLMNLRRIYEQTGRRALDPMFVNPS